MSRKFPILAPNGIFSSLYKSQTNRSAPRIGHSSIQHLSVNGDPAKISVFVVAIRIFSVKHIFGRRFRANFLKKIFERMKTEFNSAPTIERPSFGVIWIVATSFCVSISAILWGKFSVTSVTVRGVHFVGYVLSL